MALIGKALVAQGGGPTAVINQTLVGIVLEARKFPQITKVYGAVNGVAGIVREEFLDLTQETTHNLEQVALTPSSALLSTRDKPDSKYCHEIFKVLKAHDIRYFFYIGGNDSADTVRIVNDEAEATGYEMRAIHVPKTIPRAVRALPGVYRGIVMGRHAGFLAASASIAQKYPSDGPHLIYMPERVFNLEEFLSSVKKVYDEHKMCVVAISEGITDASGNPIVVSLRKDCEVDAHGNVSLSGSWVIGDLLSRKIKEQLGISRVRSDTFGYLQRSFLGCVSDVDQHEAREVGERAVQMAVWNNVDGSIAIRRTGYYSVDYRLQSLADVAGQTRVMPDEFINSAGNHVTDAFKFYVRPLLGSGLPSPSQLRAPKVPKLLNDSNH